MTKKGSNGALEEIEVKNTILEKKHTSIEKRADLAQEHVSKFTIHLFNIRHQFQRLK